MLTLKEGRVFDEQNQELFVLTEKQQDEVIKLWNPEVQSMAEIGRRQTSYTGVHLDFAGWYAADYTQYAFEEPVNCLVSDKVYQAGGVRLLTLYCNKFNFFSAAHDLGISYEALIKWFQRWRRQAIAAGVTPESLGISRGKDTLCPNVLPKDG